MTAEDIINNPTLPESVRDALKPLMDACRQEKILLTMLLEIPMATPVGDGFLMMPIVSVQIEQHPMTLQDMGKLFIKKGMYIYSGQVILE